MSALPALSLAEPSPNKPLDPVATTHKTDWMATLEATWEGLSDEHRQALVAEAHQHRQALLAHLAAGKPSSEFDPSAP